MTLFVLPNRLDVTRLGVAATRKIGGAVRRNRAKRLIRDIFRRHKPLPPGLDIVVVARPELASTPLSILEAEYLSSLQRHRRRRAH